MAKLPTSVVFMVVLLNSVAFPWEIPPKFPEPVKGEPKPTEPVKDEPKPIPTEHMVVDVTWKVPAEGDIAHYETWAADNQFFVGGTLTFKLDENSKVKHVKKEDYKTCDALNFIEDLITDDANGQVNITFPSADDYYFISPAVDYCKRGLKLSISVSASPSPTPPGSSSPAVSVGVLVPMMAVVMGFLLLAK